MSAGDPAARVVVLASRRGFEALVGPVPAAWRRRMLFVKPREGARLDAALDGARLVVSKSYLRPEVHRPILAARRAGIPTLLLVDGPLEWSNLHAHPRLRAVGARAIYDPVIHDAVAAIGDPQRRWIETRNAGRGVVLLCYANRRIRTDPPRWRMPGAPRFDFLLTTARTPWFGEDERRRLEGRLRACGEALARGGHSVLVRVPDEGLRAALRAVLPMAHFSMRGSSARAIGRARCVVGTSSSVLLEAMHHDRPTALIPFRDGPLFYGCGWSLDERADPEARFASMLARDPSRMAAQRAAVRAQLSTEDFFATCDALLRDGRLSAPRPFDALDRAFAPGPAAPR